MSSNAATAILFALGVIPFICGMFHIIDYKPNRFNVIVAATGGTFMAPALLKLWLFALAG